MSSKNAVIKVENVSKCFEIYAKPKDRLLQFFSMGKRRYFKEFWALRNINFEIYEGEVVGIIGANGAGKSTLLQIICGTLLPTAGNVNVNGRVSALLELGAGFNPNFTGIENIRLSAQLYGLSDEEISNKIDKIIDFSGIGEFVYQEVKTYSSGMFVRLAFSVIANLDPKVLIIDEALSVGDFIFQQKCASLMRESLSGVTKILVSHDLNTISSLCNRVIVISKGEIAYIGNPQEAIALYQKLARASIEDEKFSDYSLKSLSEDINNNFNSSKYTQSDYLTVSESQLSGTNRVFIRNYSWKVNENLYDKTIRKAETLIIEFSFESLVDLQHPIIGYQVQNKHGLVLFGENTMSSNFHISPLLKGNYLARLSLKWPQISTGEYGVTLGIGNGLGSTSHIVECWAHNVFTLVSLETDPNHGIFNNPLENFSLFRQ